MPALKEQAAYLGAFSDPLLPAECVHRLIWTEHIA